MELIFKSSNNQIHAIPHGLALVRAAKGHKPIRNKCDNFKELLKPKFVISHTKKKQNKKKVVNGKKTR